jgi:large subunit ribosomal protein L5
MNGIKEKQNKAFTALKEQLKLKNVMQTPKVVKVVVSVGIGSTKDKKKIELIADRIRKITGQQSVTKGAKKSIASFKVREGDPVGYQVTLRGERMLGFLDKLIAIGFPRTRDFRGISRRGIDGMGNMSIGIKEHTIFPETGDEELKDVFGLGITVVTTAKNKHDAEIFFEYLGFPFMKAETEKEKRQAASGGAAKGEKK